MSEQRRRFWRITMMYHGTETLIGEVPTPHITEERLQALMRMVFAKHTLTDEEIVGCRLRPNVKQHRNLLAVHRYRSQDPISFMVGDGSNWVHAIVVRPKNQDAALQSE
jgi:hypothetical protein